MRVIVFFASVSQEFMFLLFFMYRPNVSATDGRPHIVKLTLKQSFVWYH